MKRKIFVVMLGIEAAALCALTLFAGSFPTVFSSVMAFPFEQVGIGLRALSLSGRVGNGLAMVLYTAACLLPSVPGVVHRKDSTGKWEHIILFLLSLLLFPVLYGMINPAFIHTALPGAGDAMLPVMKSILGSSVWATVVCYAVLRLLRLFRSGSTDKLLGYLRAFLYVLCTLFVGVIAISCVGELNAGLREVQLGADRFMAVIRFFISALPYAMDIIINFSALTLLDEMRLHRRPETAAAAEKLSKICCLSLALVTVSGVALNFLQLVLIQYLSNIMTTLSIPLMSLAFVLAVLLLARLIAENQKLADDNDLFI